MKPPLDIAKSIAEKCNTSIDWLCGLSTKINYDDSIKTYGDAVRLLLKLEEKLDIAVSITPVKFDLSDNPIEFAYSVDFGNRKMKNFIDEWEKMKEYDAFLAVGDGWESNLSDEPPQE